MSLNVDSFGDLADVLYAIGLANPDGSLNRDWLSAPGDYLKTVLASESQRVALLRLLEEKLEGDKETDSEGREWLPVVTADNEVAAFFLSSIRRQPIMCVSGLVFGSGRLTRPP